MWDERTTVSSRSATASTTVCMNSRRASGSSEATGSSRRSSSGRFASASVSATCARCPPERLRTFFFSGRSSSAIAGARCVVVPARVQLPADAQHLLDREAAVERVLLREEPDARQRLGRVRARVEPEHADGAGARPCQADGEPKERRLAGAVRPDERGHAAARDLERAVAQRPLRAVAPAEPVRLECGAHADPPRRADPRCSERSASIACSSSPAARACSNQSPQRAAQLPDVVAERRRRRARHERPLAAAALRDSLALERPVRLEHGVRVDRQPGDDFLHRRQLVAGPEDPELDGVPHLLHELEVGRDSGTRVEVKLDQRHISSVIDKLRRRVKSRSGSAGRRSRRSTRSRRR